jgi:hypothetical protein
LVAPHLDLKKSLADMEGRLRALGHSLAKEGAHFVDQAEVFFGQLARGKLRLGAIFFWANRESMIRLGHPRGGDAYGHKRTVCGEFYNMDSRFTLRKPRRPLLKGAVFLGSLP